MTADNVAASGGSPTMLRKWAASLAERRTIESFLDWLRHNTRHNAAEAVDLHISSILDEYHEIDRKQLEKERLVLLDAVQAEFHEDYHHQTPGG